jgi:hypothetical protein
MKKNVGSADKIVRYIAALVIFILGFYYESWWGLIGFVPLLTAVFSWCPLYKPFKINTVKTKSAPVS